jgi:quercetin dioxygenase-like cupin family protein
MYQIDHTVKSQPFDGLQIRKPFRSEGVEVLSITLEAGAVFPEHTSPTDAFLLILEGAIDFHIDGNCFPLEKLDTFSFPKRTPHRVEARKPSRFLIVR